MTQVSPGFYNCETYDTRQRWLSYWYQIQAVSYTHLDSGVGGRPIRTLCITSPEAGEGKTVTAANLAIALAQTGLRTILILSLIHI